MSPRFNINDTAIWGLTSNLALFQRYVTKLQLSMCTMAYRSPIHDSKGEKPNNMLMVGQ